MSKSQRKHIEKVNRSKKKTIKRIDIPMDDLENARVAAEALMEAATNIDYILGLKTTVFQKLRWAQSELQDAAIEINRMANPAVREYYAKIEAEKNANQ
tara:strand:- start:188 stop:484 length:297 start_codon:yes stop_codon:yes gene_type:complete